MGRTVIFNEAGPGVGAGAAAGEQPPSPAVKAKTSRNNPTDSFFIAETRIPFPVFRL
jgi:hypothetical protein